MRLFSGTPCIYSLIWSCCESVGVSRTMTVSDREYIGSSPRWVQFAKTEDGLCLVFTPTGCSVYSTDSLSCLMPSRLVTGLSVYQCVRCMACCAHLTTPRLVSSARQLSLTSLLDSITNALTPDTGNVSVRQPRKMQKIPHRSRAHVTCLV